MNKAIHFIAVLAFAAMLNGCSPPPPPPAPYFIPNPPYPPQPIDPALVQTSQAPGVDGAVSSPAPAVGTGIGEYPMAKPTSKSNQVVSPYEPYHIIDVTGFGPGQLARDPSNRKIFRIP
jgi:hypothetical protein